MARRITLVAYDQFQLLDLAGPADVFRAATLLSSQPGYEVTVVSPDGRPVRSDSGVTVQVDAPLEAPVAETVAVEVSGADTALAE